MIRPKYLVLLFCLSLCGCGQSESSPAEGEGQSYVSYKRPAKKKLKNNGLNKGISEGISAGQSGRIISGTSLSGAFAGVFNPWKYTRALQERIRENWQIRPDLSTKSGVVSFVVDHTGSVSELVVRQSSGSPNYDQTMLDAVEKSVPLPPLVASAPARLNVEFTFDERLAHGLATADDLKKIVAEQTLVIQREPNNYRALNKRARAEMRLGNFGKALLDYKAVISAEGEDQDAKVRAYLERAKCYLYIDDYKNALADCQECQKLAPKIAKPYTLAAAADQGLGHMRDAFAALETAVDLSPTDAEAWALKANFDNLALKHQEALADATRAIDLDPEYGSAYAYRGDAYEALKDYDAALRDFTKNVELDGTESQAYVRRAELYSTLGQYDKTIFDTTEAIRLSPKNSEAYYYRAHANDELGLKAQAQSDLMRAKQLGLDKLK